MTKTIEERMALMEKILAEQAEEIKQLKGFETIAKEYQEVEYGVKYRQEFEKLKAEGKDSKTIIKQEKKMQAILDKSHHSRKSHKLEIRHHEGEEWVTVESI